MNIDEAARATRKYQWVCHDGEWFVEGTTVPESVGPFETLQEAACACDRLNMLAVLEAIREPNIEAHLAGSEILMQKCFRPEVVSNLVFRAMIDALIAEVNAQK